MNKRLAEHITNEDIQQLPLHSFEGNIHIIDSKDNFFDALHVLSRESEIGFDTETKPSFVKGESHNTALVQLSTMEDAYLFRLNVLGYPRELFELFENNEVLKLGISIADDLKDLRKLRPYQSNGFQDVNDLAKEMGIKHMGVRKLAAIFLEYRISKGQQTSNWENEILTEAQKRYAATDAWICLAIYRKLRQLGYV